MHGSDRRFAQIATNNKSGRCKASSVTGVVALYVSFAEVTNGAFGHTVIPLGAPLVKERLVRNPDEDETGTRAA